ncbi:MAG: hypothetical protein HOO06_13820 [Bdellovibrionaceae bacterium]|jgi:hypothetical protein|nr:hypothetical protein [Pseudobdellovibrionaceae bacterium]
MKKLLTICFLLILSACAHHKDVRPGSGGMHRVLVQSETEDAGARDALNQANHFCDKRSKYAVILDEKKRFVGAGDEESYKQQKRIAKATQGVGSAAAVFGGKKESQLGGLAMMGGGIYNSALGKGYSVEMRFKCE